MPRGITGLGIERAPSCFARTSGSMEKPRRRALLRSSRLRCTSARDRLPLQHTRPAPFRPSRFLWECRGCRSYGAAVHLKPCGHSGQSCSTRRGGSITVSFTQDNGEMFPSWQHACLLRDAVLRPCSVGWQMVVRVHVNGWTSSGRHAVRVAQSRRETIRCGR
ncbi:hypothetical protein TcCL_NonESM10145 [Trypanosoma cruzi]|nr:hypothetical protein TcCL_NonESM10145 [Trypanosoma cruzi]